MANSVKIGEVEPTQGEGEEMSWQEEKREGKKPPRGFEEKKNLILNAVLQQALSIVSSQKSRAVEELEHLSRAIRQTAKSLEGEGSVGISRYAEQAAEQIGKASEYFRDRELGDLLRDCEKLVQRKPALAVGGALAVGFILARFLKSSTNEGIGNRL
jgi:ElaB/YqjD/DUF883 family membrane-anchored ribosome-binding protein